MLGCGGASGQGREGLRDGRGRGWGRIHRLKYSRGTTSVGGKTGRKGGDGSYLQHKIYDNPCN